MHQLRVEVVELQDEVLDWLGSRGLLEGRAHHICRSRFHVLEKFWGVD